MALPLTSGPLIFFVALDHGRRFGATTAVGSLGGAGAEVGFCLGWRYLARRGPWPALAVASLAYVAGASAVRLVEPPLAPLLVGVLAALALGLAVLGAVRWERRPAVTPPRWELPLRMAIGTGLVVVLSWAAPTLGPRVSGLVVTYPLLTAILAFSVQRLEGPRAAIDVLRGLLVGLFSMAAFMLALAALLPRVGLPAFAVALPAALALQALSLRFARA